MMMTMIMIGLWGGGLGGFPGDYSTQFTNDDAEGGRWISGTQFFLLWLLLRGWVFSGSFCFVAMMRCWFRAPLLHIDCCYYWYTVFVWWIFCFNSILQLGVVCVVLLLVKSLCVKCVVLCLLCCRSWCSGCVFLGVFNFVGVGGGSGERVVFVCWCVLCYESFVLIEKSPSVSSNCMRIIERGGSRSEEKRRWRWKKKQRKYIISLLLNVSAFAFPPQPRLSLFLSLSISRSVCSGFFSCVWCVLSRSHFLCVCGLISQSSFKCTPPRARTFRRKLTRAKPHAHKKKKNNEHSILLAVSGLSDLSCFLWGWCRSLM